MKRDVTGILSDLVAEFLHIWTRQSDSTEPANRKHEQNPWVVVICSLPMRQSDNAKPTLWRPAEILFLVVFFKNIKSINKLAHTNSILIKWCLNLCFRSKYEEDVLINNHTSVWGSYWKDGQWGYKCCHSFIKVLLHIYDYMK